MDLSEGYISPISYAVAGLSMGLTQGAWLAVVYMAFEAIYTR